MITIIKMKKHPIDDLFAKKLAEHRQEPSQRAFENFQARLAQNQQKRKGGFFQISRNWSYYAAAAGIAIALSVGFLNQTDTPSSASLAGTTTPAMVKPSTEIPSQSTDNQAIASTETKNIFSKNSKSQSTEINKSLVEIPQETIFVNSIAKTNIQPKTVENIIIDDSPEEQTSVASSPVFENTATTSPATTEPTQGLFKSDVGESIVVVLEPEKIEDELIPALNADSPTILADAKRLGAEKEENAKSFMAKLYGEYKNFKYGEKVDLKKLGVKDVLARVDESALKEDITEVRDYVQRKMSRLRKN